MGKHSWAYNKRDKNINDRVLSVRLAVQKPLSKTHGHTEGWVAAEAEASDDTTEQLELPVSSLLLGSASEFFRAELERYQTPGAPLTLTLEPGEEEVLPFLIKLIYTDELEKLDDAMLLTLLLLAQRLNVDDCVAQCFTAFRAPGTGLSVSTAGTICQLAAERDCLCDRFASLCREAREMILLPFVDPTDSWSDEVGRRAWLDYPLAAMRVVLESDDLNIPDENTVLVNVLWWLEHNAERKGSFEALAPLLRWSHMTPSFLKRAFEQVDVLASWPSGPQVLTDALFHRASHALVKQTLQQNQLGVPDPKRMPRRGAATSSTQSSARFEVSLEELGSLDTAHMASSEDGDIRKAVGEALPRHITIDRPDAIALLAGFRAALRLQLCEDGYLCAFVELVLDVPAQPAKPSCPGSTNPVVYEAMLRLSGTVSHIIELPEASVGECMTGEEWGRCGRLVKKRDDQSAADAFRDAGFIWDNKYMEVFFIVSMPLA